MHIIRWPLREEICAYVIQLRSKAVSKLGWPPRVWKQEIIFKAQRKIPAGFCPSPSTFLLLSPCLKHCPSPCSSAGSGSFVEKAICDPRYQNHWVWESAIPEPGGKKTKPKQQTKPQSNKRESCIYSLWPAVLREFSRSPGGSGPLGPSDPATKGTSEHGSNPGCPKVPWPSSLTACPRPQGCPQKTLLLCRGFKNFCVKV